MDSPLNLIVFRGGLSSGNMDNFVFSLEEDVHKEEWEEEEEEEEEEEVEEEEGGGAFVPPKGRPTRYRDVS